jgi:phenylalanine-4-hydroxylase
MPKQPTIVEYGVEIAADLMIAPPDVDQLDLEPGHPGLGDAAYVQRRQALFDLCRRHRLQRLGPPAIEYTAEETRIWREVSPSLDALHQQHASRIYLDAKRALGIGAEGPIPYRTFYGYIAESGFPVTQFLRHGSHPEFTPEPDMIHDCLGHVPPLMNHDYASLLTRLGQASMAATSGEQVLALKRFSWFSIEFGLIQESGQTKVFGAGILSSTGEIPFSLSDDVDRRRWKTEEVITTDYDPSRMQSTLFVIPSFAFLRFEVEQVIARLGLDLPHPMH